MVTKKMRKILVTGGAGYIGSHTAVELAKAGYEPVILDNLSNSKKFIVERVSRIIGRKVALYVEDCSDAAAVAKVFKKEGAFYGVIHFAALKSVPESVKEPMRYYQNNLGGMLTLLQAISKYKVPYFVFSSSCTVYGQPDALPVHETTPLKKATSPYGETKEICERMLESFIHSAAKVRAVSLRYFNPIGAHASALIGELPLGIPQNLVPFVTQTAAGIRKQLTVYGDDYPTPDGTCIRDYIHVVDLARAHVHALAYLEKQKEGTFYDVFNVGTGRGYSVLEIVRTFEKVTGVKFPYKIGPRRTGDIEQIYANVDKAEKVLGWRTELGLEDALASAWAWQRSITG
jgi:UDP-glucose 4-epimerase